MSELWDIILKGEKYKVTKKPQRKSYPSLKDVCIVISKNPSYYQNIYRYGGLFNYVPSPCQKGHIVDAPSVARYHFYSYESLIAACNKCYPEIKIRRQ